MGFRAPDGSERDARVDGNDTQVGITYSHDAVHRDVMIQAEDYATGVSAARDYLVVTPATLEVHLVYRVQAGTGCRVQWFEGVTTSAAGSAIRSARLNRKSAKTTLTAITVGPTVTNTGTELPGGFVPGAGTGGGANGGAFAHEEAEWLLKADTKYLVRLTPASSTTIGIQFEWYEVTAYQQ